MGAVLQMKHSTLLIIQSTRLLDTDVKRASWYIQKSTNVSTYRHRKSYIYYASLPLPKLHSNMLAQLIYTLNNTEELFPHHAVQ